MIVLLLLQGQHLVPFLSGLHEVDLQLCRVLSVFIIDLRVIRAIFGSLETSCIALPGWWLSVNVSQIFYYYVIKLKLSKCRCIYDDLSRLDYTAHRGFGISKQFS